MKTTWIGSPNFSQGRGHSVDCIVVHWIVGDLAAADAVFKNQGSQASAHYGVEDGTVHQYVAEEDTAWHAGTMAMNVRSIGIEHSAAPNRPASARTIETSAKLVAAICKRHSIPCDRTHIIKHSEVVATQCPGTIPIDDIVKLAKAIMKGGEDMISIGGLNRIYRLRLGRAPDASAKKTYVGKMTEDAVDSSVMKSKEYKDLVAAAKKGKVNITRFAPEDIRNVTPELVPEKVAKPGSAEYVEVKETLYRRKK